MATFQTNLKGVEAARAQGLFSTASDFAKMVDVSTPTASRVLRGHAEPGQRVLAGAMKAFGAATFFSLFEIVDHAIRGEK